MIIMVVITIIITFLSLGPRKKKEKKKNIRGIRKMKNGLSRKLREKSVSVKNDNNSDNHSNEDR